MATRNTSGGSAARASAAEATDSSANTQAAVADMTRQHMASTASAASSMLRLLENFQQTQQHMLQRTALLQEQAAERLRAATTPAEVMAIQSTTMMSGWTELAQYLQELMLTALRAQQEMARPMQSQAQAGAAEAAATAASSMPGNAAMAPFANIMQAWQSMFNLPASTLGPAGGFTRDTR